MARYSLVKQESKHDAFTTQSTLHYITKPHVLDPWPQMVLESKGSNSTSPDNATHQEPNKQTILTALGCTVHLHTYLMPLNS